MVTGESKVWVGVNELPAEVNINMGNTTNIVTITQIPNNQYGYRIQLLDDKGDPLKDVVIKGISDPSTEIRTNAEGIVQFYSSKSSFSGLTYEGFPSHLDASMFPKTMQGYINDTSVIIVNPDTSGYYGYDITVTDNNGSILANHPVYSVNNDNVTDLGTTDSTGHLILYRTMPSLTVRATKNGYYGTTNATGTVGSLKTSNLTVDTMVYTGSLAVGKTITCMGKSWIVCHQDNHKYYLALSEIASMTKFGNNNKYIGSTLASVASQYEADLDSTYHDIMSVYAVNTTTEGVTGKIFVATNLQMITGFTYFRTDSNRICKYNGEAKSYWMSTAYIATGVNWAVYVTSTTGGPNYQDPSDVLGFRPFVCLFL